ncbi:MAG: hypothetical protein KF849_18405 [Rhizobiaceae bacterium]|nr:hypothetical protein [Rhizobiaceae bacterium]
MTARLAFWFLAGATIVVWLFMVLLTLPYIQQQAGGLAPFDLRPLGYSFDEAKAFLSALSPEGKAYYLGPQHWLDLFFPGLIAATLYCALVVLLRPYMGGSGRFVAAVAALVAIFDWLENSAVAAILNAGPDGVTADMVAAASRWTLLKSGVSTVVYTAVLVLAVIAGWRLWKRRQSADLS